MMYANFSNSSSRSSSSSRSRSRSRSSSSGTSSPKTSANYRKRFKFCINEAKERAERSSAENLNLKSKMIDKVVEARIALTEMMESFRDYRCEYEKAVFKSRLVIARDSDTDDDVDIIWYILKEGVDIKHYLVKIVMEHEFKKIGAMQNVDYVSITYTLYSSGDNYVKLCFSIDGLFNHISGVLSQVFFPEE